MSSETVDSKRDLESSGDPYLGLAQLHEARRAPGGGDSTKN